MPNNATAATVVGNKFALEYYTALSEKPHQIATYYKAESALTFGVGSFDVKDNSEPEVETFFGVQNIEKKINTVNFAGCKVVISNINCQESLNGGVVVVVLGNIALKHNDSLLPARAFVQTFYLGVQKETVYSYFVLNDIFQFVNTQHTPSPTVTHSHVSNSNPVAHTHSHPTTTTHHVVSAPTEAPKHQTHSHSHPHPHVTESQPTPTNNQVVNPQPVQPVQPVVSSTTTTNVVAENTQATTNVAPTGNQDKHKKHTDKSGSPRTSNNSEWKTSGKKPPQNKNFSKSPRTPQNDANNTNNANGEGVNHDEKKKERKEKPHQKKEKKADGQHHHENHSTISNSTSSSSSNSWAKIAVDGHTKAPDSTVAVFTPTHVVYTPPAVVTQETKPEKEVKKEKPKKERTNKPRKDDPIRAAKRNTKELRSIRVSNIPYDISDEEVRKVFSAYGDIDEVVVKKGYCYVEFDVVTGVTTVLNAAKKDKLYLGNREVKVEQRQIKQQAEPEKPFYKQEKKTEPQTPATTTTTTTTTTTNPAVDVPVTTTTTPQASTKN